MLKCDKHAPKRIKTPRHTPAYTPTAAEWQGNEPATPPLGRRPLKAVHAIGNSVWVTREYAPHAL